MSQCPRCGSPAQSQTIGGVLYLQCTWGCGATAEAPVTNDPVEDAIERRRDMRFEEIDPLEGKNDFND